MLTAGWNGSRLVKAPCANAYWPSRLNLLLSARFGSKRPGLASVAAVLRASRAPIARQRAIGHLGLPPRVLRVAAALPMRLIPAPQSHLVGGLAVLDAVPLLHHDKV